MVNFQERLDRTFKALADPTRRTILAQLERRDGASISVLAEPFAIRLPAVMKHLDVLANAGLVTRSKSGRTVTVRLRAQPMQRRVMAAIEHVVFYVSQSENTREGIDSRSPSPCARQPDPTL
jgi:DNA-binding transcriptional ArsR family regulator